MDYEVRPGIAKNQLSGWLKEAAIKYGTFQDGRVNYTDASLAPVIMCTVKCLDKILLVKRGYGLADAEGYWSTINGFIDEDKPVQDIAAQELFEELGLKVRSDQIMIAKSYTVRNPQQKRSYIIFPCLYVTHARPEIVLDHEHTEFAWILRRELENYHILDDLPLAVDSALKLL